MSNFHDRVQILRHAAGLNDEEEFFGHLKCVFGGESGTNRAAKTAVSRWASSLSFPQKDKQAAVIEFFLPFFKGKEKLVRRILDPFTYWSIADLLERFNIPFRQVERDLTSVGIAEWSGRYHKLPFMDDLSKMGENDPLSNPIKACLIGTYNMYRRHSTLPGVLKERVVVESKHRADCRGTYYQYDKHAKYNRIPFNVFPCGKYVQAFGSFRRSDKLEIIETRVLIENAFLGSGQQLHIDSEQRRFVGMLTGIYDYGMTLLAERIYIVKINDDPLLDDGFTASRLLPDSKNAEEVAEYRMVRDMVSNARDGQTLASRASRLDELE